MNYFEQILLVFLWDSNLRMEISGFDVDNFERVLREERQNQLEVISGIVYADDELMSDAEKIAEIKQLLQHKYYDEV